MNIFSKNIRFLSVLALGFMLCANMPVQAMFSARARATGLATGYATRATFAAKPSVLASGIAKPGMVNQNMAKNISFRVPMQTPSVFNAWSNRVTSAFRPFYNYVKALFPAFAPSLVLAGGLGAYSSSEIYEKQILKTLILNGDEKQLILWFENNHNKIDIAVQVIVDNILEINDSYNHKIWCWIVFFCIGYSEFHKIVNVVVENIKNINSRMLEAIINHHKKEFANKIALAIASDVDKYYDIIYELLKACDSDHANMLVDLIHDCNNIIPKDRSLYSLARDFKLYSLNFCNLKKKVQASNSVLIAASEYRNLTNDELNKIIMLGTTETENTQSRGHITCNLSRVDDFISNIKDRHLLQMFVNALLQEAVYTKQGRAVLYHGMLPDDHFRYELVTRLLSCVYDVPEKWVFLRFFNTFGAILINRMQKESGRDVIMKIDAQNAALQQQLLKGRYHANNSDYRVLCLFTNVALFGNMRNEGSCTVDYVNTCKTQHNCGFTVRELMGALGFEKGPEIKKICDELQELQIINRNLSKYGRLLQIAIPEQYINTLAYPANPSGPLKEVKIGDKLTTDMAAIVKAYQAQPDTIENSDNTETVAPLTTHALLNPKNPYDVKMVVHYAGDQQEYAEYQARFDAVMQKAYDLVCTLSNEERNKLVKGLAVIMQDGDTAHKK